MPKGQTPKLKGSICNVPIDTNDVTNILPRGADINGIIMIKLKRKLKGTTQKKDKNQDKVIFTKSNHFRFGKSTILHSKIRPLDKLKRTGGE